MVRHEFFIYRNRMNTILLKKITATCAGVVLSLTAIEIKPVQAASIFWDLEFFNDSGEQVGTGEFSYDPEATANVTAGRPPVTISVSGIVDSFSANVAGLEWGKEDFLSRTFWWVPNSAEATRGQSIRSRFGTFIVNFWELKENDAAQESPFSTLIISGGSTEFLAEGTWEQTQSIPQQNSSGNIISFDFLETQGAWTAVQRNAKSIPEGSLVFALLGIGATAFSSKLRR